MAALAHALRCMLGRSCLKQVMKQVFSTACLHTGYQFNIQFLRYFLAPIYEVHEVRQAGEHEILVKWSWTMNFWWNRFNPLRGLYDPRAFPRL